MGFVFDQSGGPHIRITTGRRDGLFASNIRADEDLPSPLLNVDGLLNVFQPKGLSLEESIAIIGGTCKASDLNFVEKLGAMISCPPILASHIQFNLISYSVSKHQMLESNS